MVHRTRSQDLQLTEQVKYPETLMRGRTQDLGSVGANLSNEVSCLQVRDENTQARDEQLIDVKKQAGAKRDRENFKLKSNSLGKSHRTEHHSVFWACIHKIV